MVHRTKPGKFPASEEQSMAYNLFVRLGAAYIGAIGILTLAVAVFG